MAGGGSGGVENSSSKNVVLGNLWSRLRILEAFLISPKSLSISLFFLAWRRRGGGGVVGGASESRLFIRKDIGSLDWSFFVTY